MDGIPNFGPKKNPNLWVFIQNLWGVWQNMIQNVFEIWFWKPLIACCHSGDESKCDIQLFSNRMYHPNGIYQAEWIYLVIGSITAIWIHSAKIRFHLAGWSHFADTVILSHYVFPTVTLLTTGYWGHKHPVQGKRQATYSRPVEPVRIGSSTVAGAPVTKHVTTAGSAVPVAPLTAGQLASTSTGATTSVIVPFRTRPNYRLVKARKMRQAPRTRRRVQAFPVLVSGLARRGGGGRRRVQSGAVGGEPARKVYRDSVVRSRRGGVDVLRQPTSVFSH